MQDLDAWGRWIESFGLPIAACVFFISWTWVRETRLSKRITELETYVHNTMYTALTDSTKVIERCTTALNEFRGAIERQSNCMLSISDALQELESKIAFKPCLLPESHPAKKLARQQQEEMLKDKEE